MMMVVVRGQQGTRALPALLAFDPGVLRAMFGPEPAVIRDILQTFIASMTSHVLKLNAAISPRDEA